MKETHPSIAFSGIQKQVWYSYSRRLLYSLSLRLAHSKSHRRRIFQFWVAKIISTVRRCSIPVTSWDSSIWRTHSMADISPCLPSSNHHDTRSALVGRKAAGKSPLPADASNCWLSSCRLSCRPSNDDGHTDR